ncbi:MAG: hypothetical protein JNK82_33720 [Myxococcaceae bacterium]|nr:hypothetical protein [Myxococcaceae bacterium]
MSVVAAGWTAACVVALVLAGRRIARYEAESPGSAGMFCGIVPLAYPMLISASLRSWLVMPAAIGVAISMLRRPELARQGRITLLYVALPTCVSLWFVVVQQLVLARH